LGLGEKINNKKISKLRGQGPSVEEIKELAEVAIEEGSSDVIEITGTIASTNTLTTTATSTAAAISDSAPNLVSPFKGDDVEVGSHSNSSEEATAEPPTEASVDKQKDPQAKTLAPTKKKKEMTELEKKQADIKKRKEIQRRVKASVKSNDRTKAANKNTQKNRDKRALKGEVKDFVI